MYQLKEGEYVISGGQLIMFKHGIEKSIPLDELDIIDFDDNLFPDVWHHVEFGDRAYDIHVFREDIWDSVDVILYPFDGYKVNTDTWIKMKLPRYD